MPVSPLPTNAFQTNAFQQNAFQIGFTIISVVVNGISYNAQPNRRSVTYTYYNPATGTSYDPSTGDPYT